MKRSEEEDQINLNKKPKLEEMSQEESSKKENFFETVGAQAQTVDDEEASKPEFVDGMRATGAQDVEGHPVQEIESLCMNCHETGITRLLLTTIPYFREVVIMSFECPHCQFKNSEIQPAAEIQERGSKYVLKLEEKKDFNRQIVKAESATCKFVELDIEIPPKRGQFTTVEGLLTEMIEDLEGDQPERKTVQPEIYEKVEAFIGKVKATIACEEGAVLPLTLIVDDPAGNSWIEYIPGEASHKWSSAEYERTLDQNVFLGLISEDQVAQDRQAAQEKIDQAERNPSSTGFVSDLTDIENFSNEVQVFAAHCSSCYAPCETHMKVVNIPHFKDVILMNTSCDKCGYKSNEVKTGGEIPEKGRRVTLFVDDPEDLARDILKSATCGLIIPELNLDLTPGTLGGRFTTIEGLLRQVYEELEGRVFSQTSDSMTGETKERWEKFFAGLQDAIDGKRKFTIVMDDPLAASYIQNVYAPDDDPNMKIEEFERTHEQNEDLGLIGMVTEGYEKSE